MDEEVVADLNKIYHYSLDHQNSEKDIFRALASLDTKYQDNLYYQFAIDGLICNIGIDRGSKTLLVTARNRLAKKLKVKRHNKWIYDLGNSILCHADLEYPYPCPIPKLSKATEFNAARRYFAEVSPDANRSFEMAMTNSANILEKYGRNLEALYQYDKAIEVNSKFGMALANKARALDYYIRLSPQKSYCLMQTVIELLEKALEDTSIDEIGGAQARESFSKQLSWYREFLQSQDQTTGQRNTESSRKLSAYHRFCLSKNLFMNFDFGYYYDRKSVMDDFFPGFVDSLKERQSERNGVMSERIYFSFQVFNQVLETYTTARFQYYLVQTKGFGNQDKLVAFTYTLDYTRHGMKYGLMKSLFCDLYNCLDKIGHLVFLYFTQQNPDPTRSLYFNWLLSDEFASVVDKNNDFQLLALRNLALDFEDGYPYNQLNRLRNRITHSFLNINEGIAYDDRFSSYEVTIESFQKSIEELFLIVKAAVMYAVVAISSIRPKGQIASMPVTKEKDIFF